eukprot:1589575-Lingulodinium_polyedra.AAC.1
MCNLYVKTKNWAKPVRGDVMAAVLVVKGSGPRNLFKEHGEASDRYCVWCAEKHHHQQGKYYNPDTGKLSNQYKRKAEASRNVHTTQ